MYFGSLNAHCRLLSQVHSDGYISLQVSSSGSADSMSDPLIAVFLSDVDTTEVGQIYYEYVTL